MRRDSILSHKILAVIALAALVFAFAVAIPTNFAKAIDADKKPGVTCTGNGAVGDRTIQPNETTRIFATFYMNLELQSTVDSLGETTLWIDDDSSVVSLADDPNIVVEYVQKDEAPQGMNDANTWYNDSKKETVPDCNFTSTVKEGRETIEGTLEIKKNTVYFVSFSVKAGDNVGGSASSVMFQGHAYPKSGAYNSTRGFIPYMIGRPQWSTTISLQDSESLPISNLQTGDHFKAVIESNQLSNYIRAKDAKFEITLPDGVEIDSDGQQVIFKPTEQPSSAAPVSKNLSADGGKYTCSFTEGEIKNMPLKSTVTATLDLVVSESAQSSIVNIGTRVYSTTSPKGEGSASAPLRIGAPVLSATVTVDKVFNEKSEPVTHAQVGDTVKYTVTVKESGGIVSARDVTLNVDWGSCFTGQSNQALPEVIDAGSEASASYTATIRENTELSPIKPKITLSRNGIQQFELSNVPGITLVEPDLNVVHEFHPTTARTGQEIEVHVHVTNPIQYSHADKIKITATLGAGLTAVEGSAKVYSAIDENFSDATAIDGVTIENNSGTVTVDFLTNSITSETPYVLVYSAKVTGDAGAACEGKATVSFGDSPDTKIDTSTFRVSNVGLDLTQTRFAAMGSGDSSATPVDLRTDGYTQVGETVVWSGTVSKTGTGIAENVVLSGEVPQGLTPVSVSVNGARVSFDTVNRTWTSNVGNLDDSNRSVDWRVSGYLVSDEGISSLKNIVKVEAKDIPVAKNENDLIVVKPSLEVVEKKVTKGEADETKYAQAGDTLAFTTTIKQATEYAYAIWAKISETLPAGLDSIRSLNAVTSIQNNKTATCSQRVLSSGKTLSLSYGAKVSDNCPNGTLTSTSSYAYELAETRQSSLNIEIVEPLASIEWDPSSPTEIGTGGTSKEFKVSVKNTVPNTQLNKVELEVTLPTGLKPAGEDASAVIPVAKADTLSESNGPLELKFSVSADESAVGTKIITATFRAANSETITKTWEVAVLKSGLNVVKTADVSLVQKQDVISFTTHIAAEGTGSYSGVVIKEPLPSGFELVGTPSLDVVNDPSLKGDSSPDERAAVELIVSGNDLIWEVRGNYIPAGYQAHVTYSVRLTKDVTQDSLNKLLSGTIVEGQDANKSYPNITLVDPSPKLTKTVVAPEAGERGWDGTGGYPALAGEEVPFELRITNPLGDQAIAANNVIVTDDIPDGLTLSEVTPVTFEVPSGYLENMLNDVVVEPTAPGGGQSQVKVSIGRLSVGETVVVTIPCVVNEGFGYESRDIENTANLEATNVEAISPANASITPYKARLSVSKTPQSVEVSAGETIRYVVTVTQEAVGNTATGVTITDTLPSGVTLQGDPEATQGTVEKSGSNIIVRNISAIKSGDPVYLTYTVKVDSGATGTLTSTASATAEGGIKAPDATATVTIKSNTPSTDRPSGGPAGGGGAGGGAMPPVTETAPAPEELDDLVASGTVTSDINSAVSDFASVTADDSTRDGNVTWTVGISDESVAQTKVADDVVSKVLGTTKASIEKAGTATAVSGEDSTITQNLKNAQERDLKRFSERVVAAAVPITDSADAKADVANAGALVGKKCSIIITYDTNEVTYTFKFVEKAAEEPDVKPDPDTKPEPVVKTVDIHRLYNEYSQVHLYTTDMNEYRTLVRDGWNDEGVAWKAPLTGTGAFTLIRFYNPYSHDHYYCPKTNTAEIAALEAGGWQRDSEASWFDSADPKTGTAVFQLFNPYRTVDTHLWTVSSVELSASVDAGWRQDNPAIWAVK